MKIPENKVTMEDLVTWENIATQLKALKASEMLLRKKIFAHFFPTFKEGTNTAPLANDWVLKAVAKYERKVDIGAWNSIKLQLVEMGVSTPDELVKWDPALVKSKYNELTAEQIHVMDQALIVTEGSPSLEIVLPKKK